MMIGIDFGTTNSGMAIYTPQGPQMIETVEGKDTLPSVVAQTDSGFVTGHAALRQQNENPDYTFRTVKRYLGVDYSDDEHGVFQLAEGPDGKIWWKGRNGLISGPQLVSEVFKSILKAAEFRLGKQPTGAVICHPVDFREPQKEALKAAAMLAGLKDVELFQEPYAAALAFGIGRREFTRVAVYDLGGGTFDITILAMKDGVTDVKGMNGIGFLGGTDFDKRLADFCVDQFFKDEGEDLKARPHCLVHLNRAAEETKIALSSDEEARVYLENLTVGADGFKSMNYGVSRDEFVQMTKDLVIRTMSAVEDALAQAEMKPRDIDHVLLVGGQSRMPLIHDVLAAKFGKQKLVMGPKPEYAVALGAAIRAAEIEGRIKPGVLEQMAAITLGLRRAGGVCVPLIAKGARYPAARTVELKTAMDGQDALEIVIVQGEASDCEDNTLVCRSSVPVEAMAEGELTVRLLAEADASGVLRITVGDNMIYGEAEE